MALIEQQEAAKQIRGNKEYVADCQWLKGYNKACEDNAQIVEKMKGQEIIHCKDCAFYEKEIGGNDGFALGMCKFIEQHYVANEGFCFWAKKKGETE